MEFDVCISYGNRFSCKTIQADDRYEAIKIIVTDREMQYLSRFYLKSIYIYGNNISVEMSENEDDFDKDF